MCVDSLLFFGLIQYHFVVEVYIPSVVQVSHSAPGREVVTPVPIREGLTPVPIREVVTPVPIREGLTHVPIREGLTPAPAMPSVAEKVLLFTGCLR